MKNFWTPQNWGFSSLYSWSTYWKTLIKPSSSLGAFRFTKSALAYWLRSLIVTPQFHSVSRINFKKLFKDISSSQAFLIAKYFVSHVNKATYVCFCVSQKIVTPYSWIMTPLVVNKFLQSAKLASENVCRSPFLVEYVRPKFLVPFKYWNAT